MTFDVNVHFAHWDFNKSCAGHDKGWPQSRSLCMQTGMTFQNRIQLHREMPHFAWHSQCVESEKNFLSLADITAVSRPFTGPATHAVTHLLLQCSRDWKKGRESALICAFSAQNGVSRRHSSVVVSVRPFSYSFQGRQMACPILLEGVCLLLTHNKTDKQKLALTVVFSEETDR